MRESIFHISHTDVAYCESRIIKQLEDIKNKFLYFLNLIFNIFSKNKYYSSNRIFNLMNKKKNGKDLNFFIKEILEDNYLQETWNKHKNTLGPSKYFSWESSIYKRIGQVLIFYALIRVLRPKNVVETGTASGSMTSFILAALNKNKCWLQ